MVESKSVKKRSVGRPKKNKALQQLRVQTWFNAVAEASGKTAYELEKEFAPSTVDRENFNKQRARLWEKYRLGKTMPTIKEKKGGRKGIAQLVEDKYPGTLRILQDSMWSLADSNVQITMDDLKIEYMSLDDEVRLLLIEDEEIINKRFWRKPHDNFGVLLHKLVEPLSESSFKGLLCLLREALICQQSTNFIDTLEALKKISVRKTQNIIIQRVSKIIIKGYQ